MKQLMWFITESDYGLLALVHDWLNCLGLFSVAEAIETTHVWKRQI